MSSLHLLSPDHIFSTWKRGISENSTAFGEWPNKIVPVKNLRDLGSRGEITATKHEQSARDKSETKTYQNTVELSELRPGLSGSLSEHRL